MKMLFPCFSMLADSRRSVPTLLVAALLSACGGGGSIPDTVQISLGTTPPASDPSNPPAGDPSTPPAGGGSDTTKPTITIETPTASSTFSAATASLALGGKASDNVGVTQVTWSNSQGGSGSTTPASGNWSIGNITLKANTSNVITVTARDAAGNAQTDTIAVSYVVAANTATLTWNENTESDLAGYRVYHGTSPGTYNQAKGSGVVVTGTSHTVTGLASGSRYYFAVTAYDSSGNESGYSREVLKDIP